MYDTRVVEAFTEVIGRNRAITNTLDQDAVALLEQVC